MTWKPTAEMIEIVDKAFWDFEIVMAHPENGVAWSNILIAVQPLIAEEAMERAARIADAFVVGSEEAPEDGDKVQTQTAESIAEAIRFASTGKSSFGTAAATSIG